MISTPIIDTLFLCVLLFLWIILFYHAILAVKGYLYFVLLKRKGQLLMTAPKDLPGVSVIVPAKNEERVVASMLDALLDLEYPRDKIEIVVVNDNSTDGTKDILDRYAAKFRRVKPVHIHTDIETASGKAAALNEGLKHSQYDYIAVFDADNLPEQMSLQYLVRALMHDKGLAAVCGKVRTFNRAKNLLTRLINIEFIVHQWLLQAGRWSMHKIAMLPGTNYVIHKRLLNEAGKWDPNALAEDSELSLRILSAGHRISFFPLAVSWEQEPENWVAWRKQRLRWMEGNKYIVRKLLLSKKMKYSGAVNFLYMFLVYFLLVFGILLSDVIFILGLFNVIKINIVGPLISLWIFAFIIFTLEIMITLSFEVGEEKWSNFGLALLMYFVYCQQWLYIAVKSFLPRRREKEKVFWQKTERF